MTKQQIEKAIERLIDRMPAYFTTADRMAFVDIARWNGYLQGIIIALSFDLPKNDHRRAYLIEAGLIQADFPSSPQTRKENDEK